MNLINDLFAGMAAALGESFAGYKVYTERLPQGFKEPCFFLQCINPTHDLFLGLKDQKRRYFRKNPMCVQYFPKDRDYAREEIHKTCETLEDCLEWITVGGDLVRGSGMHYEITDDVLSFFVDYNLFVKAVVETDPIEEMEMTQNVENE